jgi:hypothetical protein
MKRSSASVRPAMVWPGGLSCELNAVNSAPIALLVGRQPEASSDTTGAAELLGQ